MGSLGYHRTLTQRQAWSAILGDYQKAVVVPSGKRRHEVWKRD